MKKILSAILILSLLLCACGKANDSNKKDDINPDLMQVRNICELATIECYYHNVAKGEKKAGKGITHIGEKKRKFWIEYDAVAKIGIDMKDVYMEVKDDDTLVITIPKAKILGEIEIIDIDKDDIIISGDSKYNKNKLTADDQTKAIDISQEEIRENIEQDSTYFVKAQERAQSLIKNYVDKINEASGKKYKIEWKLEGAPTTVSENAPE